MPEIPEIASRAAEMNQALVGKTITDLVAAQPKCLNLPLEELQSHLQGARVESAVHRGKWIQVRTSGGYILLNMGMGGEVLLVDRAHLPEKHRLIVDFSDGTCLSINFWWFGYFHYAALDALQNHTMTAKLGPNVLDLGEPELVELIAAQKGRLKAVLLDQTKLAGIGNAYIHDILFLARLHPLRPIASLKPSELHNLYTGIRGGLEPALAKRGAFYEMDLFGKKGDFQMEDIIIGYREGQPCPACKTPIQKIKTGGTSSFICPSCQPLD
jgi:formamidopyrimidine-DNA glycosylase